MRRGLLAILAVVGFSSQASAEYELSLIAKRGDTIGGRTLSTLGTVEINNSGAIVFTAGSGIFSPDAPLVLTGDVIGGKTITSIGDWDINDVGDVLFWSEFAGGEGIFTQDTLIVESGDTIGGLTITEFEAQSAAINNIGQTCFIAGIQFGGEAVFTPNDVVAIPYVTVIAGVTVTAVGNTSYINDSGRIAFDGYSSEIGEAFFSQTDVLLAEGDIIDGVTVEGWRYAAINEPDALLVQARPEGSLDDVILVGNSLVVSEGDTIDGRTIGHFDSSRPSFNNVGELVFAASIPGVIGGGIFTPEELVAARGSICSGGLLGSQFGYPVINDNRDIVFHAAFMDGTPAFILATWIAPADFDRDGDVDGDDFLIWQDSFGIDDGGDADADGDTDGDDFLIWQSQFGSGSGATSAAVPEPASIVLLIAALVSAAFVKRRH